MVQVYNMCLDVMPPPPVHVQTNQRKRHPKKLPVRVAASQNEMNIAISNSRRLERKSLLWFVLQVGKGNCFLFKLYEFNIMYARLIFILSRRSIDYIRNLSKIKLLSLLHIFFLSIFFYLPRSLRMPGSDHHDVITQKSH